MAGRCREEDLIRAAWELGAYRKRAIKVLQLLQEPMYTRELFAAVAETGGEYDRGTGQGNIYGIIRVLERYGLVNKKEVSAGGARRLYRWLNDCGRRLLQALG